MSPVSVCLFFQRFILSELQTFSMLRTTSTHTHLFINHSLLHQIFQRSVIFFFCLGFEYFYKCAPWLVSYVLHFFSLAVSLNIHRHRFFRNLFIFFFFSKLYKSIEKNFVSFRLEINQAHLYGIRLKCFLESQVFFSVPRLRFKNRRWKNTAYSFCLIKLSLETLSYYLNCALNLIILVAIIWKRD